MSETLSYIKTSQIKCHELSGTVFQVSLNIYQMVCSVLLTVLHSKTLLFIGCEISTANQNHKNKWLLMATQRATQSTPSKRTLKTELKAGVRLVVPFC